VSTEWPVVGVIMGSKSDWEVLSEACAVLDELGVPYEAEVMSAHRTPDRVLAYAASAEGRGLQVVIAGAGGAAALPGLVAAKTHVPVLGVPVASPLLGGLDSLLSMVQMPKGVPVGTLGIGKPGAANAAILAAEIVALGNAGVRERLRAYREARRREVEETRLP
jgi:5-(carboxyamino)imidazole ribonucleotide mutase